MNAAYKDSGFPVAVRLRAERAQQEYRTQNAAAFKITAGIRRMFARRSMDPGNMRTFDRNWIQQARMDAWKRVIKRNGRARAIQRVYRGFKGRQEAKGHRAVRTIFKRRFDKKTRAIKKRVLNYDSKYGDYAYQTNAWKRSRR